MRFSVKLLNFETGFFVKKRFSFKDLFTKNEKIKLCVENEVIKKDEWSLEYGVEKRIKAITGYNFETKILEETGTCLVKWLFRDVDSNTLFNKKYFDAVIDVPLESTENWREVLIQNEANEVQLQIFNICCGNKLRFVMRSIATQDYDLFISIMQHYKDDVEFDTLIKAIGDL